MCVENFTATFCCSVNFFPTFVAMKGLSNTYFGARYYTDNIMMWLSVDPMSDKYPSMSPYMYCAGNPIMYKDPTGMIIDPAGEDEAAAYKQYRDKVFSDPKYSHIQKELTRLEEAEEVFKIRMGDNVSNETAGGNFIYNNETGEFDININSFGDFSQEEKLAHELKHADQYMDGKIAFQVDKRGNVSTLFNFRENEEEAYYRQVEIGSRNINPSSIDNILNGKKEKDSFSLSNNLYQQFISDPYLQQKNDNFNNNGHTPYKYVHKSLKY